MNYYELYSTFLQALYLQSTQIWPTCNNGITQFYLPPTHEPYLPFTPQPQGVSALWMVLISPTHEGMARLSWPRWLVTY